MPGSVLYTWFYFSVLILLKTKCLLKVLSCSDTKLEEIIKEKNKDVECTIVANVIEKQYLGEQFGIFQLKLEFY